MTEQAQEIANPLDREAVLAVDSAAQIDDILAMPDHIVDAMWRAESAMMAPDSAEALIVCGMGGSAIGADLAVAALGSTIAKPVHVVRGYDLPSWVTPDMAVLCSSYSGSTEETLSCYEQAVALGAKIYIVSAGGLISDKGHAAQQPLIGLPGVLQPRASVAYGVTSTLEVGIATGIVDPTVRADLNAAAELLRAKTAEWGPGADRDALPKRLARDAHNRLPVVYGADLTAAIAYRWKCQINENVKVPAWNATLPESNHNEICSWENAGSIAEHIAWFLRDADQNERVGKRIEINAKIANDSGARAEAIDTIGETRIERLLTTVLLGDLISLYMGVLRGDDPSPVPIIEGLKDQLGRPSSQASS